MAKISRDDVLKLAKLSKIRLSDEEVNKFVDELDAIVKYVEQIDSADTAGLKPTDQVTGLENVMRPDEVADYDETPDQLLKNAPSQEKNYIKVKRVLG
jgi:aspartyl-tRNA(Asn)/glutamyl-tRNA(Gln) amidotransferase subunit C